MNDETTSADAQRHSGRTDWNPLTALAIVSGVSAVTVSAFGLAGMLTEFLSSTLGFFCFSFYPTVCLWVRWHYRSEGRTNPFPKLVATLLPLAYVMMFLGAFLAMCALRMEHKGDLRNASILLIAACSLNLTGMLAHIFLDGLRRPEISHLMRRGIVDLWYRPDDKPGE